MDIAKIRKKLQQPEPDGQPPRKAGHTPGAEAAAGTPPDDKDVTSPFPSDHPEPAATEEKPASGTRGDKTRKNVRPEAGSKVRQAAGEPGAEAETQESVLEILTFKLLREDFAFRVSDLDEIIRFQHITPVPRLSDYVLGITSLRGKVIPVIDLKAKLSLRGSAPEDGYRRKILIIQGPKGRIGAAVDRITGVVRVAESELLPPPSHLSDDELKYISGIAVVEKRFVSILNMRETITL